jgi:DNA-binding transcriptional regulator YdaS (Cro superfamily)
MSEPAGTDKLKPTALAKAIGVSVPYASQLLSGTRTPPVPTAISIFRKTGLKLGPIAQATPEEIDVLERFQGAA